MTSSPCGSIFCRHGRAPALRGYGRLPVGRGRTHAGTPRTIQIGATIETWPRRSTLMGAMLASLWFPLESLARLLLRGEGPDVAPLLIEGFEADVLG